MREVVGEQKESQAFDLSASSQDREGRRESCCWGGGSSVAG